MIVSDPLMKPTPRITQDSVEFWQFTTEGKLMLRHCNACGNQMYYPRIICTQCLSTDLGWTQASGRGRVYAVSIIHRAAVEAFRAGGPYALAIVALEEGQRLMTNIVDCAPEDVVIDMPVELVFEPRGDVAIPLFRPAQS
ncbi:MAG: Zn-ribbon domain-containing OB-fold protein [Alphaproteobacteria bacterium]|nr:MAG: Zn-ribbon domain-containing OB-fold protein [Alphaproteobacteria bacterium]